MLILVTKDQYQIINIHPMRNKITMLQGKKICWPRDFLSWIIEQLKFVYILLFPLVISAIPFFAY
jgi:hypothetical protein